MAESARGIAPRAAHRSGHEPLDSSGSCHPRKPAGFRQDKEFLRFPVDSILTWVTCPFAPRTLLRFLAAIEQCDPGWCIGTFGLMGLPLVPFPYHRQPGSQVPYESPDKGHAFSTPDTTCPVSRYLTCSSRSSVETPVLVSSKVNFDASSEGSLALISLIHT